MTEDNFARVLRAFTRRTPFRPFVVELLSGTYLYIDHPEAISTQDGIVHHVATDEPERDFLFDSNSVSMVFDEEPGKPRRQ